MKVVEDILGHSSKNDGCIEIPPQTYKKIKHWTSQFKNKKPRFTQYDVSIGEQKIIDGYKITVELLQHNNDVSIEDEYGNKVVLPLKEL